LEACNEKKSSIGAVSSAALLTTMNHQHAVAIRFVGRRVAQSTCLFFSFGTALKRLHIAGGVSLRCNGFAVAKVQSSTT
jgi:hypothetical protein